MLDAALLIVVGVIIGLVLAVLLGWRLRVRASTASKPKVPLYTPEELEETIREFDPVREPQVLKRYLREYPALMDLGPDGQEDLRKVLNQTWFDATFAAAGTISLLRYQKIQSRNDVGGQIAMLRNGIYALSENMIIELVIPVDFSA